MEQTSVSDTFVSMLAPLCLFSAGPTVAQLERYSLILTICEPFSLFHQTVDSLFLCGNVLHKLEILYSSLTRLCFKSIVNEYDQEIPQSQTADNPVAPRGRAAQPSRGTRKTIKQKKSALSSPSR